MHMTAALVFGRTKVLPVFTKCVRITVSVEQELLFAWYMQPNALSCLACVQHGCTSFNKAHLAAIACSQ